MKSRRGGFLTWQGKVEFNFDVEVVRVEKILVFGCNGGAPVWSVHHIHAGILKMFNNDCC